MDEMNLTDSLKLLRDYADRGDEGAFRKLVEQYLDLVYSTALRRVNGDAALAQDITQMVFTDLARKAPSLRGVEMLGGWLHRHTGFVASNMVRSEHRRQVREQEAAQMNATSESSDALWQQLAPMLDDTIESLEPSDRQAVLLRFFERRDFRAIGAALDISDDAAQKRVSRALEKLRALLTERGVTLSAVILSGFLASKVVQAAPVELVSTKIARIAIAGAATQAGLGVTLLKLAGSHSFKLVLGGTVAAVALWLYLGHRPASAKGGTNPAAPIAAATSDTTNASESNQTPGTVSASQTSDTNMTGKVLSLNIVAADSGKPVPDAELDYTLTQNGKSVRTSFQATRFGVCKVPVPDDASEIKLVSGRDGFASTLLDWNPDHGEVVPGQYTLQLARAVPIGGQVVDPDGNPVAGAKVGIDVHAPASAQTRPQTDNFAYHYNATTDAQGHWQIDRIGKEGVKGVNGWATDNNFADGPLVMFASDAGSEKKLLAGTYVFTLASAIVVQGVVKNQDGQPVPNATVRVGLPDQIGATKTKARSDGTFSAVAHLRDENAITAEADGYGATTIQTNISSNSGPIELVLRPGKLLRLRVVDENGNPVAHAHVMLNTTRDGDLNGQEPPAVAIRFQKKTDATGRLVWSNAPDAQLNFIVNAPGYMVNRDSNVQPDGTEHIITLQTGLTISGTVSDATTGQPVPRFRVIAGWPEHGYFNGPTLTEDAAHPHWSTFERDWHSFDGGKFQFAYDSPIVYGEPNPDYMFKFEADGYAPYVSRIVKATEGNVRFDVQLTPAADTEVTVVSPNQKVVRDIDVGLVSQNAGLVLIPGGLSHQATGGGDQSALLQTDNHGQFALPGDPGIIKVIAANTSGYAEATPSELAANPVMQLQPWGRIEGTLLFDGQPLAGRTLSIGFGQKSELYTIHCDWTAFESKTDSQGRFVMPQVPLGNHEITVVTAFTNDMGRVGSTETSLQPVTITSNGTNTITIDTANMDLPDMMRQRFGLGGGN